MRKVLLSIAACSMIASCGGGGGASALITGVTAVSGFAAKGIISDAKVLVCRIKSGGIEVDSSCAVGSTKTNGSYTVTMLDAWTGPVLVKIQPTSNSMMLDERTGGSVPFVKELKSVVPTAATPAHVTPFSDMAATAVVKDAAIGSISSTNVINANYMVQNTLGVDLSVKPAMEAAADTALAGKQLGMVIALTKFLQAASALQGGCAGDVVSCAIDNLRNSVVSSTSLGAAAQAQLNTITTQTVTTAHIPVIDASGVLVQKHIDPTADATTLATALGKSATDAAQIKTNVQLVISQQAAANTAFQAASEQGGKITYSAPSSAFLTGLAQAKAMVDQVRTTFNYYVNQKDTGFLDLQKKRINTDTRGIMFANMDSVGNRVRVLNLGIALYDDFKAGNGNYNVASDSQGTFYYKQVGNLANLGDWYDSSEYFAICRTPSETPANTAPASISCFGANNTVRPNWTSNTRALVYGGTWMIKPTTDSNHFTFGFLRQVAQAKGNFPFLTNINVLKDAKVVDGETLAAISPIPGPYNYTTAGGNVLSVSTCSPGSTSFTSDAMTSTGTCVGYVGVGSISSTKVSDTILSQLTVTGTMPLTPKNGVIPFAGIGYEDYAVNMTRTVTSTTNIYRYRLSGSITSHEPTVNDSGVVTNTALVNTAKLELLATLSDGADGTYFDSKEETSVSTGVTTYTPVALSARLKLTGNSTYWDGVLTANSFTKDKDGVCTEPTAIGFKGSLTDNSTGGAGAFLTLDITAGLSGYSNYRCSIADSATNFALETINFTGKIKAPGRPDLSLVLGATRGFTTPTGYGPLLTESMSVNLSYNLSASGSDKFGFTGTLTRYPDWGGPNSSIALTSQDGIKLNFTKGTASKILSSDSQELGTWDTNNVIYFKDGSFVSL